MAEAKPPDAGTPDPSASVPDVHAAVAHFQSLGPWVNEAAVAAHLRAHVCDLAGMVEGNRLLGVQFADGAFYFPRWQFTDSGVVDGLAEVLEILMRTFSARETCAAWLAARIYPGSSDRYIDVLREGQKEQVIQWALQDAARVLR